MGPANRLRLKNRWVSPEAAPSRRQMKPNDEPPTGRRPAQPILPNLSVNTFSVWEITDKRLRRLRLHQSPISNLRIIGVDIAVRAGIKDPPSFLGEAGVVFWGGLGWVSLV